MKVGIPKEISPLERRVAATPSTVQRMRKLGLEVLVQAGAGEAASFQDGAYVEAGATIVAEAAKVWAEADIVLKVQHPQAINADEHEAELLREGGSLIGFIWPGQHKALVERLGARKATVLAMDAMPRITRAQKMDALSAMANVAGYRAVIEASNQYGGFFSGQVTAAGRIKPARVLVVGAGVAGLAAIAAARGLGAVVRAFDTRPAVREQIESLGASFLEFKFEESGEGVGGYAKEMSEAYLLAEQALIATHAKESDIIITTALIPGKPAPKLITSGAVISMKPGSVIVDLAAEQGGNCALTEPDRVVERYGVTLIGYSNLTSRMARQASELYAATLVTLLEDVFKPDRGITLDLEDEVHRGVVVLQAGELLWPPPTRPTLRAGGPKPDARPAHRPPPPSDSGSSRLPIVAAGLALGLAGLFSSPEFLQHLTVFLLACVVGWHVVWNVSPALHTPLMSVTNAISGIILIGGMLLVGVGAVNTTSALSLVAILLAAINVAGGFLVTQRMLRMFRK
jgi:H+-translocating NAD(P) transhydrogenase subunit alpha